MAEAEKIRMSAAEFLALPETNLPVQLLDGEVIQLTAPELDHQDVVGNVFVLFKQAAKTLGGKAYVAPVDVVLDEHNIPQPDVSWLTPDSRCKPIGTKQLSGHPDLIVEVLSPSTSREDKRYKFHLYERCGVQEYWLADPRDQLVEVWQLREGRFARLDVYGINEVFTSALIGSVDTNAVFIG